MIDPARDELSGLRDLCGGAIAFPGDDGYDAARGAFNLAVDQRPAAVAYPADANEVAEVVRCARAAGLRVAPQATGHNAGPLGSLADTVLLKTSGLGGVEIDAERQIARVGAGVRLGGRRRRGRPARPDRPARLLAQRRRRRLLARRRHGLARPQPRPADQQPDRDRARHRRRRDRPHRRGQRRRAVLGAARRRRQLRRRHRARVPALPGERDLRRLHDVGLERVRARARRPGPSGPSTPPTTSPRPSGSCSCRRCRRSRSRSAAARSS